MPITAIVYNSSTLVVVFPSKDDLLFAVLLSFLVVGSVLLSLLTSDQLLPHAKAAEALPATPVCWVLQANVTYYHGIAEVRVLFNNFMTVNLTVVDVLITGVPVQPSPGKSLPTASPGAHVLNFSVSVPSSLHLTPGEKVDLTLILTHNVTVTVPAYVGTLN